MELVVFSPITNRQLFMSTKIMRVAFLTFIVDEIYKIRRISFWSVGKVKVPRMLYKIHWQKVFSSTEFFVST